MTELLNESSRLKEERHIQIEHSGKVGRPNIDGRMKRLGPLKHRWSCKARLGRDVIDSWKLERNHN
jgi:hypothetical protein